MASTRVLGRTTSSILPNTVELKKRIRELLRDLNDIASRLNTAAARYDGYTLCYTYVKNKCGQKYYYYYLKSKNRRPRSIYLGKAARVPVGRGEVNGLLRLVARACAVLSMLEASLDLVILVLEAGGRNGAHQG